MSQGWSSSPKGSLGSSLLLAAGHGEDHRPSLRSGPSFRGKAALLRPQTLSGVFGKPRPPGKNIGGQSAAPDHSEWSRSLAEAVLPLLPRLAFFIAQGKSRVRARALTSWAPFGIEREREREKGKSPNSVCLSSPSHPSQAAGDAPSLKGCRRRKAPLRLTEVPVPHHTSVCSFRNRGRLQVPPK